MPSTDVAKFDTDEDVITLYNLTTAMLISIPHRLLSIMRWCDAIAREANHSLTQLARNSWQRGSSHVGEHQAGHAIEKYRLELN